MQIPLYRIDAFARTQFRGNPAAVVITDDWISVPLMQGIAAENNLAETAFVVPASGQFSIRWSTPTIEVDLCGHATLAAAHGLYLSDRVSGESLAFTSASGPLRVTRQGERLLLDFSSRPAHQLEVGLDVIEALGAKAGEVHEARAMMAVFDTEEETRALSPRIDSVVRQPGYGFVVTAPGRECDFVSRFFAPQVRVPEDPVTGSMHCTLIPYWSRRLGKPKLFAKQLSTRGGEL